MKHYEVLLLALLGVYGLATVKVDAAAAPIPAFPDAMGGGTFTIGGRGGTIMEITSTADSGPGTYRACLTASGPRFCICRVGGVVPIRSDVTVSSPFVTLDLQTCPGGGLIVGDNHIVGRPLNITTHDVVVRYLTLNVNNPATPTGPDTGTTGIEIGTGSYNVVLDHASCMEGGNKCEISYTSTATQAAIIHDVTVQNSIVELPNVGHPVGPMVDGIAYAYLSVNQDFHHNFFAWIGHRIALFNMNACHWVNNLTWNWSDPSAQYGFAMESQGPSLCDMVGNIWKQGNMNAGNTANPHPVNINAAGSSDCSVNCWNGAEQPSDYMSGNVCDQGTDWACAAQVTSEGGPEVGPVPASWIRKTPQPPEPNPIIADPVTGLEQKILATVGNSRGLNCDGSWFMRRNIIDSMIISAYPNGMGQLFNNQFPVPTAANAPACAEDPVTHVPTAYMEARGIPAGTSPWTVWVGDEYPIIETYGNGTGVTPPPTNPSCFTAPATCPVGASVTTIANAAIRSTPTATGGAGTQVGTQPANAAAVIVAAPIASSNPSFQWQLVNFGTGVCVPVTGPFSATCGYLGTDNITASGTPPPPHPTVTCNPQSVQVGQTSQCTANQPIVTWSASIGSISASGLYTAPAGAGTAQITGTNANGSGTVPITVTSAPPVITYPIVKYSIGVPNGPVTNVTCTPNQSTGAYTCVQQ